MIFRSSRDKIAYGNFTRTDARITLISILTEFTIDLEIGYEFLEVLAKAQRRKVISNQD